KLKMPPILSSIIRDEVEHIEGASNAQLSAIDGIAKEFDLTVEKLSEIIKYFCNEMDKGLEKTGMNVAMIPMTGVPTGKEVGTFLALDLGGTNLRVCEFTFEGEGIVKSKQHKYRITEAQRTGSGRQLFDFIADCVDKFLAEFVTDYTENAKIFKMGFTFSFPVEQTAINKGTLIKWTKGFTCSDSENKDVVFMLQEALNRKGVPAVVSALVNDTVGTLLSHSYKDPKTLIGIIYGTGTNGAYYENISKIKKLNKIPDASEKMIINVEWGAFDSETEYMSVIEADESHTLDDTKKVLEESLNIPSTTLTDRQIVKRVCQIVGLRAARLSSTTLAAVIIHCGMVECGVSVGIDGTLFELYPHFSERLETALRELFGTNFNKVKISLARDGSGVGA
ncbi:8850_t:CDS:2, partial [Racocetra fulgida]